MKFWSGPGGQILGIVVTSFVTGALAMMVLDFFVRGDVRGWIWAGMLVVFCFITVLNCRRLRKSIPPP